MMYATAAACSGEPIGCGADAIARRSLIARSAENSVLAAEAGITPGSVRTGARQSDNAAKSASTTSARASAVETELLSGPVASPFGVPAGGATRTGALSMTVIAALQRKSIASSLAWRRCLAHE